MASDSTNGKIMPELMEWFAAMIKIVLGLIEILDVMTDP